MWTEKRMLFLMLISFIMTTACNPIKEMDAKKDAKAENTAVNHKKLHPYGGWFCPDNLGGFPPMDIQELDKTPVVNGRLPTKEEASNGTSLMYFDTKEIPDAKPLDMKLPRVARIYSEHNNMSELVIIIQAVTAGKDTVVGYRYPNGGNGSAWFNQVTFLSDESVKNMGPSPFVYEKTEIAASKEKIWKAFTSTSYANQLGQRFNQKLFFNSPWTPESTAHLNYADDQGKAKGIITTVWGNLYLQIDYDYRGFHFSEKMLIIENKENNTTELHFVAGPYPKDLETQTLKWQSWLRDVKGISELSILHKQ